MLRTVTSSPAILDSIGVDQPAWTEVTSIDAAKDSLQGWVGSLFPSPIYDSNNVQHQFVRPSYVCPELPERRL